MVVVYVLDVAEFHPIVDAAKNNPDYSVTKSDGDYWRIEGGTEIVLNRRDMKLKPAVWYGIFTGGINGEIAEWNRDTVRVIPTNKPL
ncbi:MAG: hypothetical protein WBF87_13925 [Mesorhizobium sp.]